MSTFSKLLEEAKDLSVPPQNLMSREDLSQAIKDIFIM